MRVRDNYGFKGTVEQAMLNELTEGCQDGAIEILAARVTKLTEVLARFIASKISDAEELNEITGWPRYLDDK